MELNAGHNGSPDEVTLALQYTLDAQEVQKAAHLGESEAGNQAFDNAIDTIKTDIAMIRGVDLEDIDGNPIHGLWTADEKEARNELLTLVADIHNPEVLLTPEAYAEKYERMRELASDVIANIQGVEE